MSRQLSQPVPPPEAIMAALDYIISELESKDPRPDMIEPSLPVIRAAASRDVWSRAFEIKDRDVTYVASVRIERALK